MMPLRRLVLALICAMTLTSCGSDADQGPAAGLFQALKQTALVRGKGVAAPPGDLQVRAALQQAGQPILRLRVDGTGATTFLAPVAVNRGITTWSSNDRITLSSRDGVLNATRGFGQDLMTASVPSAAQIARGSGSHDRLHVYLDGADQTQKYTFTCTVATVGPERIVVLGLGFLVRHITETCSGKTGTATNHYWFQGSLLRQSTQFLIPGVPGLTIQAIIDQ